MGGKSGWEEAKDHRRDGLCKLQKDHDNPEKTIEGGSSDGSIMFYLFYLPLPS